MKLSNDTRQHFVGSVFSLILSSAEVRLLMSAKSSLLASDKQVSMIVYR